MSTNSIAPKKKDGRRAIKMNPKRKFFLDAYQNPNSPTFGNVYKSGLLAGFGEIYARNIMNKRPKWLSLNVDEMTDTAMILKARRNLTATLDDEKEKTLRHDATKFTLSRLDKRFTEKTETDITSAGLPIQENVTKALLKVYGMGDETPSHADVETKGGSVEP